ncbi:bifunctional serine/threonine protein kinase/MFS transporter [Streptomyces sp. NBC_00264]|uniref:bifunctional serine/threonine protein kinase/MFS transporter n=1 Tax=unclassified Streptomyces TaxID=2593676 RepID=UPI0022589570|nr:MULTISPECIES: bifunctional serine/threonine protein kinase/MFS transporter [unclassified Streptomyces]MCX5166312.1 bifunctional serine/threonine protein kinase/MFS transporter [Streptomyces sp. NBC_00305]MCX5224829.1 bifunctional serine/threonine protein kinase/MFS transporter [Streptomyces sp. NBC_00264]WSC25307.1 bifunctional serine/threonine protein kinase/MFS transporter [Streptomyces sp. NBC_01768]
MNPLTVEDPTRIGPYRLIARLGAGGMGLVYLGRSEVGRTVAVKVVQAEYAAQAEFRKRFAREVAAARRVGGSWTADVLDADTEAEVPWVATQYVPGPDLTTVVAQDYGPLPEHSVRVLANRLALALRAVHGAGLIHRDLKPSNVLVTVDGPRVIDFGIARAMGSLTGDSLHTRTGMLIGSPGFMSPEQVRGRELTPASDVFCLGAVLVYAATGRLLFGATDTGLNAHLFQVAEDEPDLTGVPESLVGLVRACLDKDPAKRPTPEQISTRTGGDDGDDSGVWLPGEVLAELGRRTAQLLDYVPAARAEPPAYTPTAPATPAKAPAYTPTAPAHEATAPAPRRGRGLAVIALAQLAVLFATTIGGLSHFYGEYSKYSPVTYAFAVAFVGLLLPGGHVANLVGRRRALAIGLAGFAAAGVLCALSDVFPDPGRSQMPVMILGRVLQGGFGALVTATALAMVVTGFTEPKERIRAFGIYASVSVCGPALGLLATGLLPPGPMLAIGVLLALIALACVRVLPNDRPDRTGARFDLPGVLLGSLGPAALTYGLTRAPLDGWGTLPVAAPMLGGLALVMTFLWWQGRTPTPLLPPHVLQDRSRRGGFLTMFFVGTGILSLMPPLADIMGDELGYSPDLYVLPMLPMLAAIVIGATQISPRLLRRDVPPRRIAMAGLMITPLGLALGIIAIGADASYAVLLPGVLIAGLGIGLVFTPLFATATADVVPQHSGTAAGALIAGQFVGQGIGTAVYDTLNGPPWWAVICLLLAGLITGRTMTTKAPASPQG